MRDSVNVCDWAKEGLIETADARISYRERFIQLRGAVTADNAALNQYSGPPYGRLYTKEQQMYGRKPEYSCLQRNRLKPRQMMRCRNCNSAKHTLRTCSKAKDIQTIFKTN